MVKTRKRSYKPSHKDFVTHKFCCEATYHGIHEWYKDEFEKLGWMILAKDRGLTDKINTYKNSLKRLKDSIEHKLTHVKETDRKDDLKIMWNNVNILIAHVDKDF
jgi:hypothetical protein